MRALADIRQSVDCVGAEAEGAARRGDIPGGGELAAILRYTI